METTCAPSIWVLRQRLPGFQSRSQHCKSASSPRFFITGHDYNQSSHQSQQRVTGAAECPESCGDAAGDSGCMSDI
jgi:hypothetical protein